MSDSTTTADPRPALAAALAAVEEVIARVSADDLDRPTPCSDMTVGELLGHLVMAGERATCAAQRVPLAERPTAGPDLTLDGWLPRWREPPRPPTRRGPTTRCSAR